MNDETVLLGSLSPLIGMLGTDQISAKGKLQYESLRSRKSATRVHDAASS